MAMRQTVGQIRQTEGLLRQMVGKIRQTMGRIRQTVGQIRLMGAHVMSIFVRHDPGDSLPKNVCLVIYTFDGAEHLKTNRKQIFCRVIPVPTPLAPKCNVV